MAQIAQKLAGTAPQLPDLEADLAGRDAARVGQVAAKAYGRIVAAWRLTNADAAELIAVSPRTWNRMKAGTWTGRLAQDQLLRISALAGLYKALHLYFSDALADRWVTLDNTAPAFAGRSPREKMLAGGLPAIIETRNYVDALRGGM